VIYISKGSVSVSQKLQNNTESDYAINDEYIGNIELMPDSGAGMYTIDRILCNFVGFSRHFLCHTSVFFWDAGYGNHGGFRSHLGDSEAFMTYYGEGASGYGDSIVFGKTVDILEGIAPIYHIVRAQTPAVDNLMIIRCRTKIKKGDKARTPPTYLRVHATCYYSYSGGNLS
jgi:hypothetical protein